MPQWREELEDIAWALYILLLDCETPKFAVFQKTKPSASSGLKIREGNNVVVYEVE